MPNLLKKIPNFKFPKYKSKYIGDVECLNVDFTEDDYNRIRETLDGKKRKKGPYAGTSYSTVKEIFNRSTTIFKDKDFILEVFNRKKGFESVSYGKFRRDTLSFGTALIRLLGLENERVIIIGETTYPWYVSYMAMLLGVGIAVPVDKEIPESELENLVIRSKAKAIISSPKHMETVKNVALRCENVKYVIDMKSNDDFVPLNKKVKKVKDGKKIKEDLRDEPLYTVGFDFLLGEGEVFLDVGDNTLLEKPIDKDEFAVLIFTSGTTSQAKGVKISNKNLAANVNAVTPYVHLTSDDRLFSVLPLHHTYESTIGFIYPMAVGASIAVCQGLKHLANDLKDTSPTAILGVPLLIEALYKKINTTITKSKKTAQVNTFIKITNSMKSIGIDVKRKVFKEIYNSLGGRLRIIVSAAAPIDMKVGKWLEDIGITFLQGYGLTETAPIAALTPDFDTKVGSVGKAVVGDEIKINEPNENGEGEIFIKGETVMLGYYEDEEATNNVMYDGWFNSGDIGYMDKAGFIYITGRSKNVIVTQNGKNIYPEEIEGLLADIEEIAECMVYGKEVQGEKELIVTARVIPNYEIIKEIYGVSEEDLSKDDVKKLIWTKIKAVNRNLTNYKCIKSVEIKEGQFEKTSTMKIKRYAELKNQDVH